MKVSGSRKEKMIQILEIAGWFPGRCVDISNVEQFYLSQNVVLGQSAKSFMKSYYGLADNWYIQGVPYVFEFYFYPNKYDDDLKGYLYHDSEHKILSSEHQVVVEAAREMVTFVGHAGCYYPAQVWIGESNKIYATHEYDFEVHVFQSLIDFIDWELRGYQLDYVAVEYADDSYWLDYKYFECNKKGRFRSVGMIGHEYVFEIIRGARSIPEYFSISEKEFHSFDHWKDDTDFIVRKILTRKCVKGERRKRE